MQQAPLGFDDLCAVVNDAERSLAERQGDYNPPLTWAKAPAWQRKELAIYVRCVLDGGRAELLHTQMARAMARAGWVHGVVHDAAAKTSPLVAEWSNVPATYAQKIELRHSIIAALVSWLV